MSITVYLILFISQIALGESPATPSINAQAAAGGGVTTEQQCIKDLKSFPGAMDDKLLKRACANVKVEPDCKSVQGRAIYHYNKLAAKEGGKRVLVFSLIHGDEKPAGSVGRFWLERLEDIDPRNSWRVIPVLNPDGVILNTRTNANKIDLNRNFPTRDWDTEATKYWKASTSSNPRRFPGDKAASEPETRCALHHIDDFKPDFIVSIHTPLKVLDFDGPKVNPPPFPYLPWKSLGHFPGSLGRYMWYERQTPVLTMELKDDLPSSYKPFEQLQDIIGGLVKLETQQAPAPPPTEKKSF